MSQKTQFRRRELPGLPVIVACLVIALEATGASVGRVGAGDWPMWRHDAGRTNASPEAIPSQPHLQWTRRLPPVQPAFRKARLQFDRGYEPVIMGESLFVAQPHIDAMVAYATATGEERWRFYADGPVRLAPVAWRDRIYFGSDDGYLYCLSAVDGALRWRFRAVPSERKILGNGRLISVWPLRGGPVIADGTLYFAAGVWPLEGVFVYALDAETGDVLWRNDRAGSLYGRTPHQGESFGGLSPQGYLLVNGDDLLVPCGTARPATFNRHTGELTDFSLPGEGRMPGGWFMMSDAPEAKDIRRGKIQFDSLINRDRHEDKEHTGKGMPGVRSRIKLGGVMWDYADGFEGVDGDIHSVQVANGRLFITSLDGTISCFGDADVSPIIHELSEPSPPPAPVVDAAVQAAVSEILGLANVRDGYALVLGMRDGGVAHQLAAQSNLSVIALTSSQQETDSLRRRFADSGLTHGRLSFLTGPFAELGLPPYLADVIVAEFDVVTNSVATDGVATDGAATDGDTTDGDATKLGANDLLALYECLRPYGGVACLTVGPDHDAEIRKVFDAADHPEAKIERHRDYLLIRRTGPLPGAVDYTNDWSAPDARVRAPLGMLWFDDGVGHFKRAPQPQVVGGLMISQDKKWQADPERMGPAARAHTEGTGRFRLADATFMDVYTGRVLTRAEAETRLQRIPEPPDAGYRPPYHYRPPFVDAALLEQESKPAKPAKWPFLRELNRGEMTNPITGKVEPRRYVKSYGCDGGNDYGHLITMRSATPAFYDKRTESGTINISGPRSGCTNSIIPANGVLNLPYFYDGCTCSYPLPTGAALVSMPQTFEQWTAWGGGTVGPVVRIGINFGAPGDRMTEQGTLFVDSPSVGGPSPEIMLSTEPQTPGLFYRHALFTEGGRGWPWVCASGAEGLTSVRFSELKAGTFTVRLYFLEPTQLASGVRRFDVRLQGETVLENFDVFAVSGGQMKCTVREFANVAITDTCEITLTARAGKTLLSGIELVSSGLPLDPIAVTKPPRNSQPQAADRAFEQSAP